MAHRPVVAGDQGGHEVGVVAVLTGSRCGLDLQRRGLLDDSERRLHRRLLVLAAAGKAHVVIIGSMGGLQGSKKFPGLSAYSAAKGALAILTECLAEEWKQVGISVNCLCLGAVNTEMLDEAFPGYKAPVNAADMARFIGDFALSAHDFMNGRILPVALSDPD